MFGTSDELREKLWLVLAVSLPFSVRVYLPWIHSEVIFPAEPLILLIALLHLPQVLRRMGRSDRMTLKQVAPDLLPLLYLGGVVVSTLFAKGQLFAWKAAFIQLVYVGVFFGTVRMSGQRVRGLVNRMWWAHALAFLPIALWASLGTGIQGLDREASNHASFPFYQDHTSYGAVLCFVLPLFVERAWRSDHPDGTPRTILYGTLALGVLLALLLSYSRGAWAGAFIATVVIAIQRVRSIRIRSLLLVTAAGLALTTAALMLRHERSPSDRAGSTGVARTLASMMDFHYDPSNRDRVVRWRAALSMFSESPLVGQGPGNYQFQLKDHLPSSSEEGPDIRGPVDDQDIIPWWSMADLMWIRADPERSPASGGSAHSEYLLALSEGGMVLFIPFMLITAYFWTRWVIFPASLHRHATVVVFGLAAFFIHAHVNNFLDDCKVAFLFWTGLAYLTPAAPARRT